MPFLRQSTAQTVRFGPFLDATDGVTEETGLTITPALRRLSKDGGTFAAAEGAVNSTHDSDGWYSSDLGTTDTNTVGELILNVQVPATHLPVWMRWWVLEEEVYDDMFGAAAVGYLKPVTAGRDLDVTATGAAGIDWGNIENQTTAVDLSGTDIQLCDTVTTLTGHTAQTGDSFARLGAPAGASIAADLVVIDNFVDGLESTIGVAGAGLTDLTLNAASINLFWDEAMVETTGAPVITGTFRAALEWMFALSRNRILQTATTTTLRDDADAADLATSTVSDDATTFVRGEWST